MIRSTQVSSKELDNALVSLQSNGSTIWQIHPCPVNFKGQQEDLGQGKQDLGMVVEMNFVITYFEKQTYAKIQDL